MYVCMCTLLSFLIYSSFILIVALTFWVMYASLALGAVHLVHTHLGGWVGSSLLYISIAYVMQKGGGWVKIACKIAYVLNGRLLGLEIALGNPYIKISQQNAMSQNSSNMGMFGTSKKWVCKAGTLSRILTVTFLPLKGRDRSSLFVIHMFYTLLLYHGSNGYLLGQLFTVLMVKPMPILVCRLSEYLIILAMV